MGRTKSVLGWSPAANPERMLELFLGPSLKARLIVGYAKWGAALGLRLAPRAGG